MNPHFIPYLPAIENLCQAHQVRSLHAFGSVLRQDFGLDSDVDLLVDFKESNTVNTFRRFFDFKEAMEQLLGRPVDLITPQSLSNPFFKMEVEATRQSLYAA